jgi:hypothetical protein
MDEIANNYRPKYPKNVSKVENYLVDKKRFKELIDLVPKVQNIPFSKWSHEDAGLIENSWVLFGFYFPIFENNFMNIIEYLEDDMIKDKDIIGYWKTWKKIYSVS